MCLTFSPASPGSPGSPILPGGPLLISRNWREENVNNMSVTRFRNREHLCNVGHYLTGHMTSERRLLHWHSMNSRCQIFYHLVITMCVCKVSHHLTNFSQQPHSPWWPRWSLRMTLQILKKIIWLKPTQNKDETDITQIAMNTFLIR